MIVRVKTGNRKNLEREDKHITDFIKSNPFPDRKTCTDIQVDTVKEDKSTGLVVFGTSCDYRIVKKREDSREDIFLNEDIVKEGGRELYSMSGMRDMVRCHNLLDGIIHTIQLQQRRQQGTIR